MRSPPAVHLLRPELSTPPCSTPADLPDSSPPRPARCRLPACKILPTPSGDEAGASAAASIRTRMVDEIWTPKVMPYLQSQGRRPSPRSQALAKADPDAAGAKYGNRKKQASSPWTFASTLDGTIVAAEHRVARRDHRRRRRRRRQGRRARADRPGDARHRAARQPRLRQFQRVHQPDRLRRSSARRSTPMPTRPCCRSCRAKSSRAARAKVLGAFTHRASGRTCRWSRRPRSRSGRSHDGRRPPTMSSCGCEDVTKVYPGTVAVKHANFEVRARRGQRAGRRERRRQVDADEDHRRRRAADARARSCSTARRCRFASSGDARRARHRHGVPGAEPVPQPEVAENIFIDPRDHQRPASTSTTRQQERRGRRVPRPPRGRHPARHAGRGPAHRPAAARRDRQGACRSTRAS